MGSASINHSAENLALRDTLAQLLCCLPGAPVFYAEPMFNDPEHAMIRLPEGRVQPRWSRLESMVQAKLIEEVSKDRCGIIYRICRGESTPGDQDEADE